MEIPYATSIPDRAANALKGWPVLEKNGFIAVWYAADGEDPEHYLPDIAEWSEQGWGDWAFYRSRIRAQPCDVIENIVDIAHFPHVHGGRVQSWENRFGKRSVTQLSTVKIDPAAKMIIPAGLALDLEETPEDVTAEDAWGDATYHGPSIMYYQTQSISSQVSFKSWWVNSHTAVNENEVDLCSAVIVSSLTDDPLPPEFIKLYSQMAHFAFSQDVEIWKDKVYREDPILCDGDGPINKLRRWYEQFYLPLTDAGH